MERCQRNRMLRDFPFPQSNDARKLIDAIDVVVEPLIDELASDNIGVMNAKWRLPHQSLCD